MRLVVFTEPQQGASYQDLLQVAQRAEQGGFDGFFRSDHFLAMGDTDGLPGPTDAWVTLAGLARETSRIRLGTLMSCATFRLPGPLAISVAQVDAMSDGRIELGLGAGWFEAEHAAYGIPFPPTGERFDRLAEQLAIITGLWSAPAGTTFQFPGKHYQLVDSPALPKPVQSPHPPVIVGGKGTRRTPALAARFANEFNSVVAPPQVARERFARVSAACAQAGRPTPPAYSAMGPIYCGRDEAQVQRRAAARGADPDTVRESGGLAGTPAEVVEQLRAFQAAGATRYYLQILDLADLDHLDLIAAEVLPAL